MILTTLMALTVLMTVFGLLNPALTDVTICTAVVDGAGLCAGADDLVAVVLDFANRNIVK